MGELVVIFILVQLEGNCGTSQELSEPPLSKTSERPDTVI